MWHGFIVTITGQRESWNHLALIKTIPMTQVAK